MTQQGLEIDQLRFRVKSLESQLAMVQSELDEKRMNCVGLTSALKRQNGPREMHKIPATVPSISGLEPSEDFISDMHDDCAWEKLRLEFFRMADEVARSRQSLAQADESLKQEREKRFRDIQYMKQVLAEKDREINNYKNASDSQLKRTVELEDKLAKLKSVPSTAPSTARSTSPPPAQIFSRNYFASSPPQTSAMTSFSLAPPSQYVTNMYASPVLVSRQIAPSSHVYRRSSS
jgi:hypothetical protein